MDFRDLGVRQLGSLYEGLLEYRLNWNPESGALTISQDSLVRKMTASYYTHESLVAKLVQDTLGPVLEERHKQVDSILKDWLDSLEVGKTTKGQAFLAYGFDKPKDEPDVDYVLGTFPTQNEEDPGYPSLVRGYLRAYRAGKLDALVAG